MNRSYEHYERDHFLGKQSLEISSDELYQLADEVSQKEIYLRAILDAATDGVLVVNEIDEVVLCNPMAEVFLGNELLTSVRF